MKRAERDDQIGTRYAVRRRTEEMARSLFCRKAGKKKDIKQSRVILEGLVRDYLPMKYQTRARC